MPSSGLHDNLLNLFMGTKFPEGSLLGGCLYDNRFGALGDEIMKMDIVANSGNDEFYTPEYAVNPILKYIKPNSTIWCPFDTEYSWFVRILGSEGHHVIATHKDSNNDFFNMEIPHCDYIISNPPYSCKGEVFKRLFEIGKPFAMLVGVVGLFESQKRFEMFRDNEFEILYMNRRIAYFKDYADSKPLLNPPFSSVYLCSKMLPRQICFETITKAIYTQ